MAETEPIAAAPAPVGRVIGTEDSTPLSFWVALAPDQYLQLDDVVVTDRELPGDAGSVRLSGVVTQVRARQEGAQFDSDVFLVADGVLPAETVEAAEVSTTPRRAGDVRAAASRRRRAAGVGEERDHALLFDAMEHKIPIGLGRDGAPLYANVDFIDGTRGAHVNISGVSGVATKTTYATFLLYSLFHSGCVASRGGQHEGADLQREGRGPALPRSHRTSGSTRSRRSATARSGSRRARSRAWRSRRRRAAAIPTPGRTRPRGRGACRRTSGRSRTS